MVLHKFKNTGTRKHLCGKKRTGTAITGQVNRTKSEKTEQQGRFLWIQLQLGMLTGPPTLVARTWPRKLILLRTFNKRPCLAVLILTCGAQEESPWATHPLTAMRTWALPLQQPLAHGPGQVGSSRAGHPTARGWDPSERSQHRFAGRWCASHAWSGRSLHSLAWCAEIHACTHGRMQELAAALSYTGWLPAWSRLQG